MLINPFHRWHDLVLNQRHDFPPIDIATHRAPKITEPAQAAVEEAFRQTLNFAEWDEEQMDALHSVRAAPGGVSLITGPAGTGKVRRDDPEVEDGG